jgi:hypothetical protein
MFGFDFYISPGLRISTENLRLPKHASVEDQKVKGDSGRL